MGVAELKEKIRLRLENADEHILRIVASILDKEENVVAYDGFGNALSLEGYNKKIDEAFDDLKNGNVFSNEEMRLKIAQLKHK